MKIEFTEEERSFFAEGDRMGGARLLHRLIAAALIGGAVAGAAFAAGVALAFA